MRIRIRVWIQVRVVHIHFTNCRCRSNRTPADDDDDHDDDADPFEMHTCNKIATEKFMGTLTVHCMSACNRLDSLCACNVCCTETGRWMMGMLVLDARV